MKIYVYKGTWGKDGLWFTASYCGTKIERHDGTEQRLIGCVEMDLNTQMAQESEAEGLENIRVPLEGDVSGFELGEAGHPIQTTKLEMVMGTAQY
jgi:hypothetical protein